MVLIPSSAAMGLPWPEILPWLSGPVVHTPQDMRVYVYPSMLTPIYPGCCSHRNSSQLIVVAPRLDVGNLV